MILVHIEVKTMTNYNEIIHPRTCTYCTTSITDKSTNCPTCNAPLPKCVIIYTEPPKQIIQTIYQEKPKKYESDTSQNQQLGLILLIPAIGLILITIICLLSNWLGLAICTGILAAPLLIGGIWIYPHNLLKIDF